MRQDAPRTSHPRTLLAVAAIALVAVLAPAAQAATTTLTAVADTRLDSSTPDVAGGANPELYADASPQRESLIRFDTSSLAGTTVSGVALQLTDTNYSPTGGTVILVTGSWSEATTTWNTRPTLGGTVGALPNPVSPGGTYQATLGGLGTLGSTLELAVVSGDADGAGYGALESSTPPKLVVTTGTGGGGGGNQTGTFLAAGDVANCGTSGDEHTASLIAANPGTVLMLGDTAYPTTTPSALNCYRSSWGAFLSRTWATVGDNDYPDGYAQNAVPFWSYFAGRTGAAGKGWYSFDQAGWHVIGLNANCDKVGCGAGSEQERWLKADLAAHPTTCALVTFHEPYVSAGSHVGNSAMRPLVQDLYDAGVDLMLSGHNHDYERFAPVNPSGNSDPSRGIRQFVSGLGGFSGGSQFYWPSTIQYFHGTGQAVLRIDTTSTGYTWRVLAYGGSFSDSGSGSCH